LKLIKGTENDPENYPFVTGTFDSNGNFTEYKCIETIRFNLFSQLWQSIKTNGAEQLLKFFNLIHDYFFFLKR